MNDTGRWQRFGCVLALVGAVLALFAPASRALFNLWLDTGLTSYTHGFLIAAVSLWLLWRGSPRGAADFRPRIRWLLIALLACAVLLWELSYLASLQLVCLVLLPAIAWLVLALAMGPAMARAAVFPLAFVYFAIPVWNSINGIAQELTVFVVRQLLKVTDVPAFVYGNMVEIRGAVFHVAEGCSGLHFIMVALALGALIGELRQDTAWMRLRWLLLALALALLTNWVRVYTIILAGHLTHMQHYIVRVSHYGYGWALFGVAMAVLYLLERRAALRPLQPAAAGPLLGGLPAPVASAAALVIAALPLAVNLFIDSRSVAQPATPLEARSTRSLDGWQVVDGTSGWQPVQLGADRVARERFRREGAEIELLVASYHRISQGRELGGYENRPGGGANVIASGRRVVADREVNEQELAGSNGSSLVWVEYRVGGRTFASATGAQFYYGWRTLWSLRPAPAEVRLLHSGCLPDCDAARARLGQLLTSLGGSV